MLTAALVATGLIAGVPAVLVGGMGVAAVEPRIALLLAAVVYAMGRKDAGPPETVLEGSFHQAVVAELRGGSSLRAALGQATHRVPELGLQRLERAGRAGLGVDDLQAELRSHLPQTGAAASAALAVLESTGGSAIATFEGLALLAYDQASLEHDRRVSTAQVRTSAVIVGGLPIAFLVFLLISGRFEALALRAPLMLIGGSLLLVTGALAMVWMLRSAGAGSFLEGRKHAKPQELDVLAQLVFVGLTAGLSLEAALSRAGSQLRSTLGQEVRVLLRRARHSGLAAALGSTKGHGAPFYGVLARAHLTGAPLAAAVATFLAQTREVRKMDAMERARRLPVKLLVPLSLFILPGFVLMTVAPALVDSLARVLGPLFP